MTSTLELFPYSSLAVTATVPLSQRHASLRSLVPSRLLGVFPGVHDRCTDTDDTAGNPNTANSRLQTPCSIFSASLYLLLVSIAERSSAPCSHSTPVVHRATRSLRTSPPDGSSNDFRISASLADDAASFASFAWPSPSTRFDHLKPSGPAILSTKLSFLQF